MGFSLRGLFKKEKEEEASVQTAVAPLEKPASERLSKTVMPTASRVADAEGARTLPGFLPVTPPAASVELPRVSLGEEPAAPAAAPESASAQGRTVAVPLAELLPQIPAELLETTEIDPGHRVVFKAAELERGMANGRPAVSLRSIYQQAPLIFTGEVGAQDEREVSLPFHQVLQQLANLQDQGEEPAIAPDAAAESAAPMTPPQAEPPPPAPRKPIRLAMPPSASAPASPAAATSPAPVKISPHGTGESAAERVPASSGPPVPIPLPAPFAPAPVARIPFKIKPAGEPESALRALRSPALAEDGPRLALSLRAILRGVPPFQFTGQLDEIPEEVKIELPIALVLPQLSLGRVAISQGQFHSAMPEEFRSLFKLDEGGLPVSLPLPEVLQNLPGRSLELRGDQETPEILPSFDTPFSQKAAEDAKRLGGSASTPAKAPEQEEAASAAAEPAEPASERTALQKEFDTDETLDAKSVVAHASRLPGVSGCAVVCDDGLGLANNLSAEFEAEALCAMAPEIIKRIDEQMTGAHLGALRSLTLFCENAAVSFFAHGHVCLAAVHSTPELTSEVRQRLGRVTGELAAMYAQPASRG